jgi:hypothetical protein
MSITAAFAIARDRYTINRLDEYKKESRNVWTYTIHRTNISTQTKQNVSGTAIY